MDNIPKLDIGIRKAFEIKALFEENRKKAKENSKSKD